MTTNEIRPGDRVQYKGTGPVMIVLSVSQDLCYCTWGDDASSLQHSTFRKENLVPAREDKPRD